MLSSWRSLRAVALRPRPRLLTTSQFPGRSGVMRSVSSTPVHLGTVPHDEENDTSELGAEFFGTYSVILPPEPFIFGVSHIPRRPVPSHIARPSYVTPSTHGQSNPCVSSGDSRIQLDSPGEWRLRRAARLAREVLEYAGTLVKVKAGVRRFPNALTFSVGRHHHGCPGRRDSSIRCVPFGLSIASRLFWFSKIVLY